MVDVIDDRRDNNGAVDADAIEQRLEPADVALAVAAISTDTKSRNGAEMGEGHGGRWAPIKERQHIASRCVGTVDLAANQARALG